LLYPHLVPNSIPLPLISGTVIVVSMTIMLLLERFAPLRQRVEPVPRHTIRNLSTGAISLAFMSLLQAPLLIPVAAWTTRHDFGLVNWLSLGSPWSLVVSLICLDYTLWWWHRASHLIPFLWRFHLVHHVDLDLDSSTALRFHFGELILSICYRAAQIALIGATPFSVWLWQTILFASILFHHGNVRMPFGLERLLVRILVTPRMHAVHHLARRDLTDSNWSSILSVWDYLHRTYKDVAIAEEVEVPTGVPAYLDRGKVTIGRILALPFVKRGDDWR
jgi:sterol desaturase/sphingolipid hydroxylase (fatty acid hydroxylase superfamily)